MNRDRYVRNNLTPAEVTAWRALDDPEEKNRLFFYWWCDDIDREIFIGELAGRPAKVPSRTPFEPDPSPPLTLPAAQGFREPEIILLSDRADVRKALTNNLDFSNAPYADLGGGSFLLAQDPLLTGQPGPDWHAEQKALIDRLLKVYTGAPLPAPATSPLQVLASESVRQAALTTLVRDEFDVAQLAEQAALRYLGQLYGFAVQDHGVLEDASRSVYRALQYVAVGQHFVTEPALLPAARQALARLILRCSQLMESYRWLDKAPRRFGPEDRQRSPDGVVPWTQQRFSGLGKPLLARLPNEPGPTSGRDRAAIVATLLAGTAGNVVGAACLVLDSLMKEDAAGQRACLKSLPPGAGLAGALQPLLAARPPLPVLPRRTRREGVTLSDGTRLAQDTDCLVLLEALAAQRGCPHAWGEDAGGVATHACLGQALTLPLLEQLVHHVLNLPLLRRALDPLTGRPLPLERLWGFSCTSLPLFHERNASVQRCRPLRQNLIISMRVKSPVGENAAILRRLIAGAVPRIDQVLAGFKHVVHAWFEFSDGDDQLVLRTIFEGDFDAYIKYFAVHAGDLFDALFEHLEDSPPRPVAEFPDDFIETIRRFNRAPLAGYLYGA